MSRPLLIAIGVLAGVFGGLLGVGGGIIMVPLLLLIGMSQHEAHATSLAAIVPIAIAGAIRFGLASEIDVLVAALLAAGAIVGAPMGARVMAKTSEGALKVMFGLLTTAIGITLLWS